MENKRIAFQGEPGAYSEQALFLLEPHAESQPYREFRDVAEAVVQGRADLGLLPIENSLVGSIATNFDLIAESGLAIVGEVVSSVHHCLLGVAGASRESLRRVLSHPVALAQCERFLRQLAGVEVVAFYDTAGAAAEVARQGDRSLAAIAGALAARRAGEDDAAAQAAAPARHAGARARAARRRRAQPDQAREPTRPHHAVGVSLLSGHRSARGGPRHGGRHPRSRSAGRGGDRAGRLSAVHAARGVNRG